MGRAASSRTKRKPKAEPPPVIANLRAWLHGCGWWESERGWRHRLLFYPWPMSDAVKLSDEAWDGRSELVYRMLREDDDA